MLLSFVQYLDSRHPLREFNDLPEPLRLTDVSFDCLLGTTIFLIINYPKSKSAKVINAFTQLISRHFFSSHPCRSFN